MRRDHARVDQHADRDEEDRRENIAHRLHELLDRLFDARFGDQAAGDETPRGPRSSRTPPPDRPTQRPAPRWPRPSFPAGRARRRTASKRGTSNRPTTSSTQETPAAGRREPASAGVSSSPDERAVRIVISRMAIRSSTISTAEDELRELAFDPLLLERFDDDRRAGDRDHRPGIEAVQPRPAERLARQIAEPDHQAALHDGDERGGRPDAQELLEAELDAQREHQQDHAQLGERLHDVACRRAAGSECTGRRSSRPADSPAPPAAGGAGTTTVVTAAAHSTIDSVARNMNVVHPAGSLESLALDHSPSLPPCTTRQCAPRRSARFRLTSRRDAR